MEPWHLLGAWDGVRSTSLLSPERRIPGIWELKSHNIPQPSLPCAMYLFSPAGFILYPFHPPASYWAPAVLEASACVHPDKLYPRSMPGTRRCSSRGYSSPRAYFPSDPRSCQGPPRGPCSGELTASTCLPSNSCSLCQALKWVRGRRAQLSESCLVRKAKQESCDRVQLPRVLNPVSCFPNSYTLSLYRFPPPPSNGHPLGSGSTLIR